MTRTQIFRAGTIGFTILAGLMLASPAALAAGGEAEGGSGEPPSTEQAVQILGPDGERAVPDEAAQSEAEQYCSHIADVAKDRRYARETERLKELEGRVDKRIAALEAKRADYQKWLTERRAFLDRASKLVVDIYTEMAEPEAAEQLAEIDPADAASIVVKLDSRKASAVMAEMEATDAAAIAKLIVTKTAAGEAPSKADDAARVAEAGESS